MDFNSAIDLIKRELEEAIEIIENLKNIEGVSRIEVELARSKCRNAASVLEHLKAVKAVEAVEAIKAEDKKAPKAEDKKAPETVKEEERPVVKDPEPLPPSTTIIPEKSRNEPPVVQHSHGHSHGEEHSHPHAGAHEHPHDEEHQHHSHGHSHDHDHEHPHPHPHTHARKEEHFELENNPEESDPDLAITSDNDTSGPGKPYVAPIIADSFSHLASRFNEQLGKEHHEASYMKKRRFSKLTDAIGVNDKFYYIREIFNGDREAYSHVISHLESVDSISEAKKIIMGHRKEKTENEAVNQLLDLVKRKLSPDE